MQAACSSWVHRLSQVGQTVMQALEESLKLINQDDLFEVLEDFSIGHVPGVQHRIGTDKDREMTIEGMIESIHKTIFSKADTGHHALAIEDCSLLCIQPKVFESGK